MGRFSFRVCKNPGFSVPGVLPQDIVLVASFVGRYSKPVTSQRGLLGSSLCLNPTLVSFLCLPTILSPEYTENWSPSRPSDADMKRKEAGLLPRLWPIDLVLSPNPCNSRTCLIEASVRASL